MSPEKLLDRVEDLESFVAFVEALAEERRQAERLEKEQPIHYQLGGALGWQNGDIASYLEAALTYFEEKRPAPHHVESAWRTFAEFLYCGKIIE
ncbi:MAG TPA: hypothetical protein VH643_11790 [Gemmataceae bacterium]|jgi:hypothetical protein